MSWVDDFSYLGAALQQGYVGSQPARAWRPFRPLPGAGYSPWDVSQPNAPNWLDFSTRQIPAASAAPAGFAAGTRGKQYQVVAPERLSINPYGPPRSPRRHAARRATSSGPLGGAVGSVLGVVNPFNAIPWLMERADVAANALADGTRDVPVLGAVTGAGAHVADAFVNTVQAASDAVAPVLEALPNWYRDTQLADKAKVYAAIVRGQTLDPWSEFTMSGNLLPFSSGGARSAYGECIGYHKMVVDSMDPSIRAPVLPGRGEGTRHGRRQGAPRRRRDVAGHRGGRDRG